MTHPSRPMIDLTRTGPGPASPAPTRQVSPPRAIREVHGACLGCRESLVRGQRAGEGCRRDSGLRRTDTRAMPPVRRRVGRSCARPLAELVTRSSATGRGGASTGVIERHERDRSRRRPWRGTRRDPSLTTPRTSSRARHRRRGSQTWAENRSSPSLAAVARRLTLALRRPAARTRRRARASRRTPTSPPGRSARSRRRAVAAGDGSRRPHHPFRTRSVRRARDPAITSSAPNSTRIAIKESSAKNARTAPSGP
jgi:hypothetical protein